MSPGADRRSARGPTLPAVADRKPPKQASGERETLVGLLQYQRDSIVRKVDGLTEEQVRWSPVRSGTSLLWLVRHLTTAEALWLLHRFAGLPEVVVPSDQLAAADHVADAVAAYRAMWAQADAVIGTARSTTSAGPRPSRRRRTCAGCWLTCWRRRPATPGTLTSSAADRRADGPLTSRLIGHPLVAPRPRRAVVEEDVDTTPLGPRAAAGSGRGDCGRPARRRR